MVRIHGEEGPLESFEDIDGAVRWLERRERKSRGEFEWVRVQLLHEARVEVLPPVSREEYCLEHVFGAGGPEDAD
jgi:hypothetical protein